MKFHFPAASMILSLLIFLCFSCSSKHTPFSSPPVFHWFFDCPFFNTLILRNPTDFSLIGTTLYLNSSSAKLEYQPLSYNLLRLDVASSSVRQMGSWSSVVLVTVCLDSRGHYCHLTCCWGILLEFDLSTKASVNCNYLEINHSSFPVRTSHCSSKQRRLGFVQETQLI